MLKEISTRADKQLDKEATKRKLFSLKEELATLQNLLYAEGKHAILVVIQGMDASGKDGLINDVFGGLNPQGVSVTSFKVPTAEELSHDFLWRIHKNTPAKGMIKVFNRSHYEDVLVTRVHNIIDDKTAKARIKAINDFEQLLINNSTHILKLYLHVSPERQEQRLKDRMSIPEKMWKYNENDLIEAKQFDEYLNYYEEVFEKCNVVPWNIIPADQNWYKSYLVAAMLRNLLVQLKMEFPGMKETSTP